MPSPAPPPPARTRFVASLAVVALLLPRAALADDLSGLAVVVSAVFVGGPAALLLVGLWLAARSLARRGRPAPAFARAATVLSLLAPLSVPLGTLLLGGDSAPLLGLSLLVALPLAVLAFASIRAARRLAA